MNNRYYKYLFDIDECIKNIEKYVGASCTFENYNNNTMLQAAVERKLEIIGEAIKNLLEITPEIEINNARKIVNTRNRISHGYDDIENAEIWNIIINHLPTLKTEVQKLLNNE